MFKNGFRSTRKKAILGILVKIVCFEIIIPLEPNIQNLKLKAFWDSPKSKYKKYTGWVVPGVTIDTLVKKPFLVRNPDLTKQEIIKRL